MQQAEVCLRLFSSFPIMGRFFIGRCIFSDNHTGRHPTENPHFIDDSLLYMVLFVRKKPAKGWSTVFK
jgi:hypothetical protein